MITTKDKVPPNSQYSITEFFTNYVLMKYMLTGREGAKINSARNEETEKLFITLIRPNRHIALP